MEGLSISIDELCYAIETKDNNKKVRIDFENLKSVYSNLLNLLGDNLDFSVGTLRYAYKALFSDFKIWMDNHYDNEQLCQLEDIFIKFIRLPSELHTSGIRNNKLKAYAYYGLHAINCIRGEYHIALCNVFKIFVIHPRMARYDLCNDIYNGFINPMIPDTLKVEWINMNKEIKFYKDKELTLGEMRKDSDLRRYRLEEIEQKIDYQCVIIAEKLLQEFRSIGDIL